MMASSTLMEDQKSGAIELLKSGARIIVITGAGISAESGIPTFRGEGGYWRTKRVDELATPEAFAEDPRLVWDWYCERRQTVASCSPNAAHIALADWARGKSNVTLVTQNVDGLHDRAGHPDHVRLHGSLWRNRCTKCGTERDETALEYTELPMSPCCNALERPAIVWFGEMLSKDSNERLLRAFALAKIVFVIGTSGVVKPIAIMLQLASENGKLVINVNPESVVFPTDIDFRAKAADLVPSLLL